MTQFSRSQLKQWGIKNLKIIPINGVYADQELINYVKNNRSIIGTMDKDLKNKIKKLDSSILSIHNDKIVLESQKTLFFK